jgi:hypothetical protein
MSITTVSSRLLHVPRRAGRLRLRRGEQGKHVRPHDATERMAGAVHGGEHGVGTACVPDPVHVRLVPCASNAQCGGASVCAGSCASTVLPIWAWAGDVAAC